MCAGVIEFIAEGSVKDVGILAGPEAVKVLEMRLEAALLQRRGARDGAYGREQRETNR